jgi:hypothetical protein
MLGLLYLHLLVVAHQSWGVRAIQVDGLSILDYHLLDRDSWPFLFLGGFVVEFVRQAEVQVLLIILAIWASHQDIFDLLWSVVALRDQLGLECAMIIQLGLLHLQASLLNQPLLFLLHLHASLVQSRAWVRNLLDLLIVSEPVGAPDPRDGLAVSNGFVVGALIGLFALIVLLLLLGGLGSLQNTVVGSLLSVLELYSNLFAQSFMLV